MGPRSHASIFNIQISIGFELAVLPSSSLEVYDIRGFRLVERVVFDAWSLVSPILSHTTNGSVSYSDAITEVSHSFRVYKGKIFVLVGGSRNFPYHNS